MNSPNTGAGLVIMTATPVVSLDGHLIGELAGQVKPESLAGLLQQGLLSDKEGRIFLVDRQNHLLDASSTSPLLAPSNTVPITAHSRGIVQALQSQTSGFLSYTNHLGKSVYGVYRWIPGLNESLLVEQDLAVVLTSIINNQVVNLLIIGAGILLAVSIAILTSRRIATPLASLVLASAEIAGGNLDQRVQVERQDEIGVLARAFNTMTAQLRSLITDLEARVRDRTAELQARNQQLIKRARQMETTSQVSREITSLLDVDSLLNRVVNLIQSSFAYYHVNIYLLDQASNRLVWRAGSGTVSPENQILEMKRISLNSKAAQENQAVLVNNIQQDPSFLADPNLPDTLSELVLPLRMGDQVMGTMDIHHSILGAFSPEDLTVLQGLGDQIAIAIHNAQLYEKNQALAVIEERSRMARELHDSISQLLYCQVLYADAGGKYFRAGQSSKALDYVDQLKVTANQALKEMRLMIYELRPSILESEGLLGAIRHRLETVECRSGVEAQLDGDPSLEIPQPIEKELYLIAQEALNNVLKHANARAVNVTLSKDNGDLVFTIRDDGIGFDPENIKSGLGLDNIRQHAQRMGGTITIISQPGQGTQLAIRIPGGQNDG